jgi:MFS family permease
MLVANSTMGSALPCMAIPQITAEFGHVSQEQKVLPISIFLLGYVFGPVIWAPLSEQYGRKYLTTATFLAFSLFTMACALSPTWSSLLGFRLCCGVFASAPIAVVAGILADMYGDARVRGKAYSAFLVVRMPPLLTNSNEDDEDDEEHIAMKRTSSRRLTILLYRQQSSAPSLAR